MGNYRRKKRISHFKQRDRAKAGAAPIETRQVLHKIWCGSAHYFLPQIFAPTIGMIQIYSFFGHDAPGTFTSEQLSIELSNSIFAASVSNAWHHFTVTITPQPDVTSGSAWTMQRSETERLTNPSEIFAGAMIWTPQHEQQYIIHQYAPEL